MEDLLRRTLMLAAESGAELLALLEKVVDSAEYEDDIVKLDPEIMNEVRNFLHDYKRGSEKDSNTLH